MRRIEQIIQFLSDADGLGIGFARAAFRPWRHRAPFATPLPSVGQIIVRCGDSDIGTVRTVFRDRDYAIPSAAVSQRMRDRYNAILASGNMPLIIDAGANIGASALWFNAEYPGARILAIEPDAGNLELLARNTDSLDNIEIVAAAIGGEPGFVALIDHGASDAFRTERSENGLQIVTMNELLAQHQNTAPFIVKIDIEGFEKDLFAANTEWIDQFESIMVELHDWMLPGQQSSATVQREMGRRTDFEIFLKGENLIYVRL
jgi:FkbM family methyltransferase